MTATWYTRDGGEYIGTVYNVGKDSASYDHQDACVRCGGAGGWRGWPGFTCYRCHGSGCEEVATTKVYTAEKLAALNATRDKRAARKAAVLAEREAARKAEAAVIRDAFIAANREAVETLRQYADRDGFVAEMVARLDDRGTLTENQIAAAMRGIERVKAREASAFVGAIGDRVTLTVTCDRVIGLESANPLWAAQSIYLLRDQLGNRIVYKGSGSLIGVGDTAVVKATVADHETYRDEAQTRIARPKVVETKGNISADSPCILP